MQLSTVLIIIIIQQIYCQNNQDKRRIFVEYGSGQDSYELQAYLEGIQRAFYVDIGGFDSYLHSNTFHFYLKGWKGLVAEPNPERFHLFNIERPRQVHLNVAVGEKDKILTLHEAPDSTTSTVSELVSQSNQIYKWFNKSVHVSSLTLGQICQRFYLERPIFMNVDAAGYTGRALESNNWKNPLCVPDIIFAQKSPFNNISGFTLPQQVLLKNGYKQVINDFKANNVYIKQDVYQYMIKKRDENKKKFLSQYRVLFFTQIVQILKQELNLTTKISLHYNRSADDVNYYHAMPGEPVYLQKIQEANTWFIRKRQYIVVLNFNPHRQYIVLSSQNYTVNVVYVKGLKFSNITFNPSISRSALILDLGIQPQIKNKIVVIKNNYPFFDEREISLMAQNSNNQVIREQTRKLEKQMIKSDEKVQAIISSFQTLSKQINDFELLYIQNYELSQRLQKMEKVNKNTYQSNEQVRKKVDQYQGISIVLLSIIICMLSFIIYCLHRYKMFMHKINHQRQQFYGIASTAQ